MTYTELNQLFTVAAECADLDEYMQKESAESPALLADVWELHENPTYRTLVRISSTSNRQIILKYKIPRRTAEDWHTGNSQIAPYMLLLLAVDILEEKYQKN